MAEQPISSRLKVEDGVNKPDFYRAGRGHEMTVEAQDGKVLGGELTPWRIHKKPKRTTTPKSVESNDTDTN